MGSAWFLWVHSLGSAKTYNLSLNNPKFYCFLWTPSGTCALVTLSQTCAAGSREQMHAHLCHGSLSM